jgi:SAM-dependent methyltransferase
MDLEPIWDNVRKVRYHVDYSGTRVLDVASFDGLWAFEAETAGAAQVVATDCLTNTFENLLLIRTILDSKVIPYFNVSPYNLADRLDVFFEENFGQEGQHANRFDIVQHLGLLYHLRDPMLSLAQARSVLKPGGMMLIETEVVLGRNDSALVFNGIPGTPRLRDNYSVWWAPTELCLDEMLRANFLEPVVESSSTVEFEVPVSEGGRVDSSQHVELQRMGRKAMWCTAIEPVGPVSKWEREMLRTFRNPGLDIRRLGWSDRADGQQGFLD